MADRGRPAYRRGKRLSLTISPQVHDVIGRLARSGLYGHGSRAEAAQILLYASVRHSEMAMGMLRPGGKARRG